MNKNIVHIIVHTFGFFVLFLLLVITFQGITTNLPAEGGGTASRILYSLVVVGFFLSFLSAMILVILQSANEKQEKEIRDIKAEQQEIKKMLQQLLDEKKQNNEETIKE